MAIFENIPPLYSIILSAIVLIILIVVFRVRLKFLITRMMYGKYHYKYLRLFNRYFINRPYPDALKDEPWDYVQNVFKTKPKTQIATEEDIQFVDLKVGEVYPDFFKQHGDPEYLTISDPHQNQAQFIVAGYKARVYNYEAMLVYFFVENLLVMGQFRFRREKQPIDINHLTEKLVERYQVKNPGNNLKSFQIRDRNNTCINFMDNGFSVELNVINHQKEQLQQLFNKSSFQSSTEEIFDKEAVTF